MRNTIIIALSLLVLAGCVYTPKEILYYDKDCDLVSKKLVLSQSEVDFFITGRTKCSDDGCIQLALASVAGAALIGPVSAIISGTIVVAGNTIFWLEKTVNCHRVK